MAEADWLALVTAQRAIAVIRASELELGVQMARAVAAGGMQLLEVTWNSTNPIHLVQRLRTELPHCMIGAGTLLTLKDMQQAIDAGAEFLFTPHTNLAQIQTAVSQQVPVIPGALSPSEIVTAWQAGATCVKVFPIDSVGGAAYIRHLQGPIGQIPLIPTGGVTLENAREFIDAGAVAIGLAGQLFPREAVAAGNWELVRQRAAGLMAGLGNGEVGEMGEIGRWER